MGKLFETPPKLKYNFIKMLQDTLPMTLPQLFPYDKNEMIRVNHAGEYGAQYIYKGQLFFLKNEPSLVKMAKQEDAHLKAFTNLMIEHAVRPSYLQPLWCVGGFLMGALTAAAGRNVAHACTAAVETIIDKHYQNQVDVLQNQPDEFSQDIKTLILKCQEEECEHKEIAYQESEVNLEKEYPFTTFIIKNITKAAIKIAKKI